MMVVSSKGDAVRIHSLPDHVHITGRTESLWCMLPWARCQGDVPYLFVVHEPECDWTEVQ